MSVNIQQLIQKKNLNSPICMLTCYDATFAKLLDRVGIDILLIGDSLGMVVQGNKSTIKVKIEDMIYHTRCVSNATKNSMIMVDMPFGSYQESPEKAYSNAAQLMEAGAQIVKLEGGKCNIVHLLVILPLESFIYCFVDGFIFIDIILLSLF